jgi:hypothetical protein
MIRFRDGDDNAEHNKQQQTGAEPRMDGELSRALHARIRHAYYDRPEVLKELARRILDDIKADDTTKK